tara:strand:- start:156 stop:338 length:183 start_codon:yes stop_codon:yes gene_type:complete
MKETFLLFILFIFSSCSNDGEDELMWGYACIDYECVSAVDGPYENLENCINLCSLNQNKD